MFRHITVVCAVVLACGLGTAWGRQTQKVAYMLALVDVSDPQQYGEYTKLSPGVIAKFGGRFVARAGRTTVLEGAPFRGRVVVVEFPSFERAQEFYNSPEYQAAKKVRENAAGAQFILVEGL